MVSLKTVPDRSYSTYQRDDGYLFKGHIFVPQEGSFAEYDWSLERLIMRTAPDCVVTPKNIMFDTYGRRHLVARHGSGMLNDARLYKSFRLIELTHEMEWSRTEANRIDPVTGAKRTSGKTILGNVWVSLEPDGGRDDGKMNIHADKFRVATGADVQEGDFLDDIPVRRVAEVIGINLIELQ